jgi:hypothetical protein
VIRGGAIISDDLFPQVEVSTAFLVSCAKLVKVQIVFQSSMRRHVSCKFRLSLTPNYLAGTEGQKVIFCETMSYLLEVRRDGRKDSWSLVHIALRELE